MKIFEVRSRNQMLVKNLLEIWENSVKATHTFLSEEEIGNIKKICATSIKEYNIFNNCRK